MYTVERHYADGTSETAELSWSRAMTMLRDQQTSPDANVTSIRVQRIVDGVAVLDEAATLA